MLNYLEVNDDGPWDIIKITNEEYEDILRVLHQINEQSTDHEYKKTANKLTPDRLVPPTIESLKAHHVRSHIKEYLPMLIYFAENEFYKSEDPEFKNVRNYIKKILSEQLVIKIKEEGETLSEVFKDHACK